MTQAQNQKKADSEIIDAVEDLENNLRKAGEKYDHALKEIKEKALRDFSERERDIEDKQIADLDKAIDKL